MRNRFITLALAAAVPLTALAATPVMAQSRSDQARWDAAQRRYDDETRIYQNERDRYQSARNYRGGYRGGGYQNGQQAYNDDRYDPNYDASRYYRDGPTYQERTLAADDRVYRGNDGRYYCQRSDGTTGLIIGAGAGGILGNVIDGGHSRTAGTLLGAAVGALAGRAIDQNNSQNNVRCR